jgi:O-antigen/teichoic acid export membrane protein
MLVLTLNSCLWTGAVIAVVHAGGGMVPLAFAFVATAFVTSGLQFAFATRQNTLRMRGSVGFWRELARTGIPLGIAGLLTLAYVRIDGVLVYELAGASQAGQYSAVYRVLDRAQLIPESMATTLLPIFAACYGHNLRRLRRLFDAAVTHLSALTLPALAFTVVAAGPIVTALFGPTYAPAAAALPILMGTFVLISMGLLLESMIIAIGQAGRLARYALAALVVNVCLNLLIVPSYGFVGAAWVTVATQLVLVLLSFRCVLAKLGVLPPIGPTLRAGLASAVMGGCVYFLHKIGWPLALLALAAPALYLPLVFGLGVVKPTDAVALVRGLPLGRLKPHQQSQLSAPEEAG